MADAWGRKYANCENCGTVDFDRRWHGFCSRCAPGAQTLRRLEAWRADDPATCGNINARGGEPFCGPEEYIGYVREACREELALIAGVEAMVRGDQPILSIDVETAQVSFRGVFRVCPVRHGGQEAIGRILDEDGQCLIYSWLWDWMIGSRRRRSEFSVWVQAYNHGKNVYLARRDGYNPPPFGEPLRR
jgi:hypothetical protein